jgi:lipoprotein-releasing system permease protein
LGAQTSLVEAYPIKRKVSDFVYTVISVVLMTLIAAYRPAQLATKTKMHVHI